MTHPEREKLHPETRMILTLDTSMAAVGDEGSTKRAVFNKASSLQHSEQSLTSI